MAENWSVGIEIFPTMDSTQNSYTISTLNSNALSTLNSNANSILKPKKTTSGRRKIPIAKINNKNRKHVTFSKRRKGLFKKASELCILCGASVAVIAFSEAGKVFTFSHPSVDGVINRYLLGSSSTAAVVSDQRMWWERSIQELEFEELEPFRSALVELRDNVGRSIRDIDLEFLSKSALMQTAIKNEFAQPSMAPIDHRYNINGVSPAVSYVSPEFLPQNGMNLENYNHQQYQYCGCGCMGSDYDIGSIVAMPTSDRACR